MSFPFHSFIKHFICICTSDCVEVIYPKLSLMIQHCKSEPPEVPRPVPGYEARPRPGTCGLFWRLGDCDAGDTSTILAGHFTPSYTVTQDTQYGHLSKTQISINGPAEAWSMGVAQLLSGSHPFVYYHQVTTPWDLVSVNTLSL